VRGVVVGALLCRAEGRGLSDSRPCPKRPARGARGAPESSTTTRHSTCASAHSAASGPPRVVSTDSRLLFQALDGVFGDLGFGALGDHVFRDLVLARVVEPTSILDAGRSWRT